MQRHLHLVHSINGGFVDTLGFVTLHGLFAAHVTGNIITLAASFATGTHQAVAKVLAIPVYCAAIVIFRAISYPVARHGAPRHLRFLQILNVVALAIAAILALLYGPFPNADAPLAVLTGMIMVAGMSVQNVVRRIHLPTIPPTTVMTGAVTQLMIDLVDLVYERGATPTSPTSQRARVMARGLGGFCVGATLAATLIVWAGQLAFIVPPLIAAVALGVCFLSPGEP